jgi:F-type H+-transporting ATPase subunit delta
MADAVTLARPYAEAAFKLAKQHQSFAAWSDTIQLLEAVTADPRVSTSINNPNFGTEQIERLLLGICGDRLDGHGRNFVQVLAQADRLVLLPQIRELYEQLRAEHEGVLEAKIQSAFPMTDEQVRALVARLEAKYKRKVTPQVGVDAELIGGVRVVVGDKVLDATVRGKLETMAAALTH